MIPSIFFRTRETTSLSPHEIKRHSLLNNLELLKIVTSFLGSKSEIKLANTSSWMRKNVAACLVETIGSEKFIGSTRVPSEFDLENVQDVLVVRSMNFNLKNYKYAPRVIREDPSFAQKAIHAYPLSLEFASEAIKQSDIAVQAVRKDYRAIRFLSTKLENYDRFCTSLLIKEAKALNFLPWKSYPRYFILYYCLKIYKFYLQFIKIFTNFNK